MLARIKASLPTLSLAESRVAKLVLLNARVFSTLPISELANRAKVSKPTVVRFCRSVGCIGLSDFKLKLAASLNQGVPFIHKSVDGADGAVEVLAKVVDNSVAALLKYRNDASTHLLDRASLALAGTQKSHRRIEFYGVGNSGIVALDAQHKFFRLGLNTIAHSDGHMQVMSASLLQQGDCVVVISNTGRTRDLIDSCEIARKRGATIIAITASGSPLAADAHIHLAADHAEDADRYSPMVSRLLHLMMIDVLTTCTALHIGAASLQPILKEMKINLKRKRYT